MLTKLKLNSNGIKRLLHNPALVADLKARAERVATQAGADLDAPEGMTVIDASDTNRARFIVLTTTAEAMAAEAQDRRLTAAIDAAR